MSHFNYTDSPYSIREDIREAHRFFWSRLGAPGCWWNGAQRLAIAAEVRLATNCTFCAERKSALSPYTLAGEHDHGSGLSPAAIDAVHRIVTDQDRITQSYVDRNVDQGLSKEAYVELAGVVVSLFSIDEFHRALGLALEPLPQPSSGKASLYRPSQAVSGTGFVPMLPPDGATGSEADLWPNGRTANVLRALSLVPDALRDWMKLSSAQYLSMQGMANFDRQEGRAINRMQMELIAGRVSSVNECFY